MPRDRRTARRPSSGSSERRCAAPPPPRPRSPPRWWHRSRVGRTTAARRPSAGRVSRPSCALAASPTPCEDHSKQSGTGCNLTMAAKCHTMPYHARTVTNPPQSALDTHRTRLSTRPPRHDRRRRPRPRGRRPDRARERRDARRRGGGADPAAGRGARAVGGLVAAYRFYYAFGGQIGMVGRPAPAARLSTTTSSAPSSS